MHGVNDVESHTSNIPQAVAFIIVVNRCTLMILLCNVME